MNDHRWAWTLAGELLRVLSREGAQFATWTAADFCVRCGLVRRARTDYEGTFGYPHTGSVDCTPRIGSWTTAVELGLARLRTDEHEASWRV